MLMNDKAVKSSREIKKIGNHFSFVPELRVIKQRTAAEIYKKKSRSMQERFIKRNLFFMTIISHPSIACAINCLYIFVRIRFDFFSYSANCNI